MYSNTFLPQGFCISCFPCLKSSLGSSKCCLTLIFLILAQWAFLDLLNSSLAHHPASFIQSFITITSYLVYVFVWLVLNSPRPLISNENKTREQCMSYSLLYSNAYRVPDTVDKQVIPDVQWMWQLSPWNPFFLGTFSSSSRCSSCLIQTRSLLPFPGCRHHCEQFPPVAFVGLLAWRCLRVTFFSLPSLPQVPTMKAWHQWQRGGGVGGYKSCPHLSLSRIDSAV